MYYRKWKPSKTKRREFAQKMDEIEEFCFVHNIRHSSNKDSYYFTINGQDYRVSNHSVEASNRGAYHEVYGKVREAYHPEGRRVDTIYIHASKTRIIEIYENLKAGKRLDGRGNVIHEVETTVYDSKLKGELILFSHYLMTERYEEAEELFFPMFETFFTNKTDDLSKIIEQYMKDFDRLNDEYTKLKQELYKLGQEFQELSCF